MIKKSVFYRIITLLLIVASLVLVSVGLKMQIFYATSVNSTHYATPLQMWPLWSLSASLLIFAAHFFRRSVNIPFLSKFQKDLFTTNKKFKINMITNGVALILILFNVLILFSYIIYALFTTNIHNDHLNNSINVIVKLVVSLIVLVILVASSSHQLSKILTEHYGKED